MCVDPDVQQLNWEALANKRLRRAAPANHMRVFFKDLGYLLGIALVK
jgi:geranylgeranyl diphosphate/geranylgeranyl-bacteriochlorophyllide a reductase